VTVPSSSVSSSASSSASSSPSPTAARPVRLDKLHATGNDFLVVVDLADELVLDAVALCDRRRGIGADGLIRVLAGTDGADLTMDLVNADGSPAEMSGNGTRCLAWVAVDRGLVADDFTLATGGGTRSVHVQRDAAGAVVAASVDMGVPVHGDTDLVAHVPPLDGVDGARYQGDTVSMGNPHLVLFVDEPAVVPIAAHGPVLEHDPRFPQRTNVHFAVSDGTDRLRLVTWERGAGATLSCGTGASATAAVARRRGLVGDAVTVAVPGGELRATFTEDGTVVLAGPVVHVFAADLGDGLKGAATWTGGADRRSARRVGAPS
jgi:diaminopimelate epimerase